MNILVTGAGGYLGSHVVPALAAAGFRVRAGVHGHPPSGAQLKPDHECLPGAQDTYVIDLEDRATLAEPLEGMDAVVNLAAVLRERPGTTYLGTNYHGVRNLVGAMKEAGVRRLIHLSPLGTSDEVRLRYAYSRWQGESIVRESDLDWTILAPSVLFGPGFGLLDRMVQSLDMAPRGIAAVPGGGRTWFQPIHAADAASAVVAALQSGDRHFRRAYPLGGPERLRYRTMLQRVLEALGERRLLVPVPLALMAPVVPILERRLPDPPVTTDEFALIGRSETADPEIIRREFGVEPRPMTVESLAYLKEQRMANAARRRELAARLKEEGAGAERGPFAR